MKDRYLFRGKHIHIVESNKHLDGSWVYGSIIFDGLIAYINCNKEGYEMLVYPDTIGQCTGLKDKNGNLIFEGDIVEYGNGTYTVTWWHAQYLIENKHESAAFNDVMACDFKVIGNIHEIKEYDI